MDHQPAAVSVSRPLIGLFQSPDTHTAEYRKRIGALYEAKRVRLVEVEAAVAAARDAEERAKQVCGGIRIMWTPNFMTRSKQVIKVIYCFYHTRGIQLTSVAYEDFSL